MRLKSLHISGFKSFCHPVKLDFIQKGITVVVGPNGCGKSNVADAILWVLGEQSAKHLRGSGMEDVIFAGSDFQKPTGVAEVTLTFENTSALPLPRHYQEFSEISVSRKLYRSGESIYMINKLPVRLMDVRELFMDTGIGTQSYAIIEQGKVGEIVGAKPLDRRFLIEEAAGIVKFKTKRQTAERRLESTQQNLLRIEDLLQEIHRQEETLREQVEKANLYLSLKKESEHIDQQLSLFRWQKALQQEKAAAAQTEAHQAHQAQLLKNRHLQEKNLKALSQTLARQNAQLESLREAVFQKERDLQESENKQTLEQQNLRNYQEWLQQHTQELAELQKKLSLLHEQLVSTQQAIQSLEESHEKFTHAVEQIEQTRQEETRLLHALNEEGQTCQKRLLTIHTQLTNHTNQQGFLKERWSHLEERTLRLDEQNQANQEQLEQTLVQISKTKETTASHQTRQTEIRHCLQTLETEWQSHSKALAHTEKQLQASQYRQQTLLSRLESLKTIQADYEDFDESVKNFLAMLNESPETKTRLGILGVLAEFLTLAPQKINEIAPALADYLDVFLIQKAEDLAEIENFCREKELGRLGFIALDQQPRLALASVPSMGVALTDFIQFEAPAQALAQGFLSQIYFIQEDHLWQSFALGDEKVDWISPQGSYCTQQGLVKIGQPRLTSFGFLERKNQIAALQSQSAEEQKTLEGLQKEQTILQQRCVEGQEKIDAEKHQEHESDLELSRLQKELEHDQLEHQRALQMQGQLQSDKAQLQQENATIQQQQEELTNTFGQLEQERQTLEAQLAQQQHSIQTQQQTVEQIAEELLASRVSLTESYEQLKSKQAQAQRFREEISGGQQRLQGLENSQKEILEKSQKSRRVIEDTQTQCAQLLENRDELKEKLATQTVLHQTVTQQRSQASTALQNLTKELDHLLTKLHEEQLCATEQRMKREQLEQQLLQTYGRSPQQMTSDRPWQDVNESQLARQWQQLKQRMEGMAPVNLGAPQEYATLQERMAFLEQQSADLQKALHDLRQSIREINRESRRRFQETFEQVNRHFQEVFTTLFEGGKAEMVLTAAEDVLEAGVEIVAQPPGKKLQNLNLLSGGEKALTAISLIFAIFLIKPSPFCLLDEVDAPLDDVNVGRFNLIIQQLLAHSQFILITHNKKTMELGQRLYGVTMEEPGISKMVSVQFQEATEMAV